MLIAPTVNAVFGNLKLFTPLSINCQLNLNTNTERVNSLIVLGHNIVFNRIVYNFT